MSKSYKSVLDYLTKQLGSPSSTGTNYYFHCPFCMEEVGTESEGRKLGVDLDKGLSGCFRCGKGFRSLKGLLKAIGGGKLVLEAADALENVSVASAPRRFRADVLVSLFATTSQDVERLHAYPMPKGAEALTPFLDSSIPFRLRRAFGYLRRRRVSDAMIKQFDIHFTSTGRYAERLIFPVTYRKRQVYFTNRYIGQHKFKTLSPENKVGMFTRRHVLLNFDKCIGKKRVAICEGPFDCMAHKNAVALLGKKITDEQVRLLLELAGKGTEEFVISLDDEATYEAHGLHDRLSPLLPKVSILYIDKGDPDERKDDLPELMRNRVESVSLRDRMSARVRKAQSNQWGRKKRAKRGDKLSGKDSTVERRK